MAYVDQIVFDEEIAKIHEQHTADNTALANAIDSLATPTNYYTMSEVDEIVAGVVDSIPEYATKVYVDEQMATIYHEHIQDITAIANALSISPALDGSQFSGFYTKDEVNTLIAGVSTEPVDLTGYYTSAQVDTLIAGVSSGGTTNTDVTNINYDSSGNITSYTQGGIVHTVMYGAYGNPVSITKE